MESVLKGCPVVGNVCVYGDSNKSYVVAVICPVPATLKEIAGKFGKADMSFEEQCKDKDVTGAVLREVILLNRILCPSIIILLLGGKPCQEQQTRKVRNTWSCDPHPH